jgi:transposase
VRASRPKVRITCFAFSSPAVEVGLGAKCDLMAPTLVPVKAGDRVRTNRRDAEKLARCYRSGDLTPVWGPDDGSEALRDLLRAHEAAESLIEVGNDRQGRQLCYFLALQNRLLESRRPLFSRWWAVPIDLYVVDNRCHR